MKHDKKKKEVNVLKLLEMIKSLMALCFILPHTEVCYQIYTDAASRLVRIGLGFTSYAS